MGLACQNNLYFLKGSTFIGGAALVADKIVEFASGTSRIWYMHLGHAGKNALQGLRKGTKTCKLDFMR